MSYIQLIMKKENIQQLQKFLLGNDETIGITEENYEEKIAAAEDKFSRMMDKYHFTEDSEMMTAMREIIEIYQKVLEEVGVQVGFYLARHILETKEH